jgi:hypothetical protein
MLAVNMIIVLMDSAEFEPECIMAENGTYIKNYF